MNRPPGGLEGAPHLPKGKRVVVCEGSPPTCDCAPHKSKMDAVR